MPKTPTPPIAPLRDAVIDALPELARSEFTVLTEGWDSVGLEADGWIFKFPRHEDAVRRLRKEYSILGMIRPRVALPVPDMVLFESPRLFSRHRKLIGEHLLPDQYPALTELQRDTMAEALAALYAQLHAIPHAQAREAGATPIDPWKSPEDVAQCASYLPADMQPLLLPTLDAYAAIKPEPGETVYGYFDGHGWNMAFDHSTGALNGVYDFADSGFGARHQDFSYSNWISRDLTLRIIARYERLTGISIERERVMLYSQMLRFLEFSDTPADAPDLADRLQALRDWFR